MSYSPPIDEFPDRPQNRDRIPPGQRKVDGFPVLSINSEPFFDGEKWDLVIDGLVENPLTLSYEELLKLKKTTLKVDFHCVTGWSRLDLQWAGVSFQTLCELVKPLSNAHYVTSSGHENYTSSLPFEDYMNDTDVLIAYELEGKPLVSVHGGPLRLLIPKIYAYKSTKWLKKLTFTEKWERGFWEQIGYHQRADPWLDERFSSQEERAIKKKRLELEKEHKKNEREKRNASL